MKKVKFLLLSLISIFAFNINVFAASGSLGVSSSSVYVGDSFTVTANVSSAAAWNIHVSASGSVSGCSINEANVSEDANDISDRFEATCTATGEGTITLTLSGDVISESDENVTDISGTKTVTVTKKSQNTSSVTNNETNSGTKNSTITSETTSSNSSTTNNIKVDTKK